MVKLHCGKVIAPVATGMKPESMPVVGVVMFWHGAAKVDWVAVWFLDWNWNATVSPTEAFTLVGLNVTVSLPPTITVKVCWAETATTRTRAAMRVEKRIFEQSKWNQRLEIS